MYTEEPHDVTDLPRIGGPHGSETEFYLAERWETDSHGVTHCGDLLIGRDPDDPLSFFLEAHPGYTAGFSNGSRPAYRSSDPFPTQYADTAQAVYAIIAHRFANLGLKPPPRDGLDEWVEKAEGYVWEAIEEERERLAREATEELAALPGQTAAEILAETPVEPEWIVPGVLAPGWAVMLAGREKLGKGSFVFYMLGRLEQGGQETVFGTLPEQPVTAVIYTEEPEESVREKLAAFGLTRAHTSSTAGSLHTWRPGRRRLPSSWRSPFGSEPGSCSWTTSPAPAASRRSPATSYRGSGWNLSSRALDRSDCRSSSTITTRRAATPPRTCRAAVPRSPARSRSSSTCSASAGAWTTVGAS